MDEVRNLIKILAESHMAFDLGDNSTFEQTYRQTKVGLSARMSMFNNIE